MDEVEVTRDFAGREGSGGRSGGVTLVEGTYTEVWE